MVTPWLFKRTALGNTGLRDDRFLAFVGFTGIPLRTESSCDEPYMDHGRFFKADKESLLG